MAKKEKVKNKTENEKELEDKENQAINSIIDNQKERVDKIEELVESKKEEETIVTQKQDPDKVEKDKTNQTQDYIMDTKVLVQAVNTQDYTDKLISDTYDNLKTANMIKSSYTNERAQLIASQLDSKSASKYSEQYGQYIDIIPSARKIHQIKDKYPYIFRIERKPIPDYSSNTYEYTNALPYDIPSQNSMDFFSPGTMLCSYLMDSFNCDYKILDDFKTLTKFTFDLNIVLKPTQREGTELSTINLALNLLSTIMKMSKSGDFFYRPSGTKYKSLLTSEFSRIKNEYYYESGYSPYLLQSTYEPYFILNQIKDDIQNNQSLEPDNINNGAFYLGATNDKTIVQPFNKVMRERFGMLTDNLIPLFNSIFLREYDSRLISTNVRKSEYEIIAYYEQIKINTPFIQPYLQQTKFFSTIPTYYVHSYIYKYVSSESLRQANYTYLNELLDFIFHPKFVELGTVMNTLPKNFMPGIQGEYYNNAINNLTALLMNIDLKTVQRTMIQEMHHSFIDLRVVNPINPSTYQKAFIYLFLVVFEALYFPSLFWSNPHIYSYDLYKSFEVILDVGKMNYNRHRYSATHQEPQQYDASSTRNGDIANFFLNNRDLNSYLFRFKNLLSPLGVQIDVKTSNLPYSPHFSSDLKYYTPFEYNEKVRDFQAHTTLLQSRLSLISSFFEETLIKNSILERKYQGPYITFFKSLFGQKIRESASTFAYTDYADAFRRLINGFEIPYFSYKGLTYYDELSQKKFAVIDEYSTGEVVCEAVLTNDPYVFGTGAYIYLTCGTSGIVNRSDLMQQKPYISPSSRLERYFSACEMTKSIFEILSLGQFYLDHLTAPSSLDTLNLVSIFRNNLPNSFRKDLIKFIYQDVYQEKNLLMYDPDEDNKNIGYEKTQMLKPRLKLMNSDGGILDLELRDFKSELVNGPLEQFDTYSNEKLTSAAQFVLRYPSSYLKIRRGIVISKGLYEHFNYRNQPDINGATYSFKYDEMNNFCRINDRGIFCLYIDNTEVPSDGSGFQDIVIELSTLEWFSHGKSPYLKLLALMIFSSGWTLILNDITFFYDVSDISFSDEMKILSTYNEYDHLNTIMDSFSTISVSDITNMIFKNTVLTQYDNMGNARQGGVVQFLTPLVELDRFEVCHKILNPATPNIELIDPDVDVFDYERFRIGGLDDFNRPIDDFGYVKLINPPNFNNYVLAITKDFDPNFTIDFEIIQSSLQYVH